ncbi:MAG: hypothetical protein JSV09_02285 [Thermoplasmata archaeon]|nr:MAG: hypothetical protein JSV09_02285 [Thermoplasmata archaeon]
MKKSKGTENTGELLSDCNCLNCRLGRIEEQLDTLQTALESMNPPANPGKSSRSKRKKK